MFTKRYTISISICGPDTGLLIAKPAVVDRGAIRIVKERPLTESRVFAPLTHKFIVIAGLAR